MKDNDNLTIERPTFVTHLECAMEGDHYPADQIHNLSQAGKPLLVRYDLAGVKKALTKDALAQRPPDLWRYRELLPVRATQTSSASAKAMTPLLRLPNSASKLGGGEMFVKDESRLPTGTFKARGLVMAVVDGEGARHHARGDADGRQRRARRSRPTRRRAGIEATSSCPDDTPDVNVSEIELQGANVYRVNGLINDCGKIVREGKDRDGLVRPLDAQGAVPHRRQEDDGPGAGRATRLEAARRDPLSDRRRHRPDRHVEGVRRAGGDSA